MMENKLYKLADLFVMIHTARGATLRTIALLANAVMCLAPMASANWCVQMNIVLNVAHLISALNVKKDTNSLMTTANFIAMM